MILFNAVFELKYLSETFEIFKWVQSLPSNIVSIIQSIVPAIFVSALVGILPFILRGMLKGNFALLNYCQLYVIVIVLAVIEGIPTKSKIQSSVMDKYFFFLASLF